MTTEMPADISFAAGDAVAASHEEALARRFREEADAVAAPTREAAHVKTASPVKGFAVPYFCTGSDHSRGHEC
jgi:hypothetical protein